MTPVYETMDGWREPTPGPARGATCRRRRSSTCAGIEELIGCPVAMLSTSPERDDTILVSDPFTT